MSDIMELNVTKFQWPLLITLGAVDEKRGRGNLPPAGDRLTNTS